MTKYAFDPKPVPVIPIENSQSVYPINRIFCVGRNYEAHAKEMGAEVDREAPFYFTKTPSAALASGNDFPYPPGTENLHYEMELALTIGKPVFRANAAEAAEAIHAYGAALDMTRRDRQQDGKDKRRPWDLGKDFENAAVFAPLCLASDFGKVGGQRIFLEVNGEVKQDALLSDLIHSCVEIIQHLSGYYHLEPGDVILTGTPAGVGPVVAGDRITGGIEGLAPISLDIVAAV